MANSPSASAVCLWAVKGRSNKRLLGLAVPIHFYLSNKHFGGTSRFIINQFWLLAQSFFLLFLFFSLFTLIHFYAANSILYFTTRESRTVHRYTPLSFFPSFIELRYAQFGSRINYFLLLVDAVWCGKCEADPSRWCLFIIRHCRFVCQPGLRYRGLGSGRGQEWEFKFNLDSLISMGLCKGSAVETLSFISF